MIVAWLLRCGVNYMEPAPETCLHSQHIWKTSLQQVRYHWLVAHDHCLNRYPAVQGFIQDFFYHVGRGVSVHPPPPVWNPAVTSIVLHHSRVLALITSLPPLSSFYLFLFLVIFSFFLSFDSPSLLSPLPLAFIPLLLSVSPPLPQQIW